MNRTLLTLNGILLEVESNGASMAMVVLVFS